MWCHLPTIFYRRRALLFTASALLIVAFITAVIFSHVTHAAAGINKTINFQGRLFTSAGATVPDGYYNIQFKIYQDGTGTAAGNPGGTLKWTENWINNNAQAGVQIKNGFLSVNLGANNAFGSSVDWNQDTLWLSMNIAGSDNACTSYGSAPCTADGEMVPMRRMTATPYALNAGALNGLTSGNFVQLAQGVQTDASTNTTSIYLNKTAGGNFLQLQSSAVDVFTLSNSGDVTFGNNANHTLSVTTAGAGVAGKSLTMSAGGGGSGSGSAGGDLVLQGGAAGGTNANGGNVTIDAGVKTGSGTAGSINIGTATASTIQIGSTTLSSGTQSIGIGNNNTSGGTTNVTIGAGGSATAGTTAIQSKDNTTFATNGTTRATFDTSNNLYLGNGVTAAAPNNFVVQGTGSSTTAVAGGTIAIQGGAATVGNANGGGLTLDAGAKAGSGVDGNINIGTLHATTIQMGSTTLSSGTQTIAIGNNNTSGSTTNVTIGSGGSATAGTTAIQSKDTTTISTNGSTRATFSSTSATLYLGNGITAAAPDNSAFRATGSSTTGVAGGSMTIQGGMATVGNANGGSLYLEAGNGFGSGTAGVVTMGVSNNASIQIGNNTLSSGTQSIGIGNNNTAGGTTNVTIGGGSATTAGTTTIQAKDTVTINTNGVARATFGNTSNVYFGNGVTAAAPNNFTISGTGSSTTAVTGGAITLQGGNATVGNANGGNVTITGGTGFGTGVNGLVILTTPTFSTTANDANCYTGGALVASSCSISAASVNGSSSVLVGFNTSSQTATLPDPTTTTAGRIIYVTAANGSSDFTLSVNGGGTGNQIAMRQNTTATMIWNGSDWTAAGASSSTTLQSAYDNTLQSAGGAELVVSKTSATNGLTIRDSSANPVSGALLSIQSSSAAGLFSVNSNLTEYASNAGAETAGGTSSTFPASTWDKQGNASVAVSRNTTTNNNSIATGQASVSVTTTNNADDGVKNTLTQLTANQTYNVSFTARLSSGTFTNMSVHYSRDGTTTSLTSCKTGQAIATSVWTKVNCSFTAPSSGITSSNAIFIRQATATVRTFYVDNLSVTLAADHSYVTDGSVDDSGNFSTNWPAIASATVTRDTTVGNDASSSTKVVATTAGQGVKNKLSVNPIPSTLYRVTLYLAATASFSTFKVQYTYNDSTLTDCVDYNTQTASTNLSAFQKITCYIQTPANAVTNPYLYLTQTDSSSHTWYVDTLSMTLATGSTPNVQIGGGLNGGPTTLFTLDKGASAPIAGDNESLLGSMYYDTSLGKLQCYEADGWGACGSSPDNIVTISPEYTNAVMHGTGVGTMTSDLCSGFFNINDPTNGPQICDESETYNFYKWTSPQATAQAYSIYVTYQLPNTFKSFASGSTSLQARVDNTTNASVKMQIFKNSGGLSACGTDTTITTSVNTWQAPIASGSADPSTCGFSPGNSIVFKITMSANSNANAYIANLGFTFSNN